MIKRLIWRLERFVAQRDWILNRVIKFLNNSNIIKYNVHVFLPPEERIVEYPFVYWAVGLPPGRVLDVGCYSRLPIELASLGFETYGIDLRKHPFSHPDFRFIRGDIRHTDFQNDFFDIVTAVSVIEHIGLDAYGGEVGPSGDVKAIKEIRRILKPGGRLILSVPFGKSYHISNGFERVYDNRSLKLLLKGFRVSIFKTYASRDGVWGLVNIKETKEGYLQKCIALTIASKPEAPLQKKRSASRARG